jgi:hypothetical protein
LQADVVFTINNSTNTNLYAHKQSNHLHMFLCSIYSVTLFERSYNCIPFAPSGLE